MRRSKSAEPVLVSLYRQYLDDEHAASFISAVAERYTLATLERLAEYGPRVTRRAAMLALGFIAPFESNAVLGRGLHDEDRGVRLLAENGIRDLWCRIGTAEQRGLLKSIMREINSEQLVDAVRHSNELIQEAPFFAEAWNQRAIAYFQMGYYEVSARDCQQALELNPYHFPAAIGLANCYLELDEGLSALASFRHALRINPDLESVRVQVEYLERSFEGK